MHPFVIVFMAIWFTGIFSIGGAVFVKSVAMIFTESSHFKGTPLSVLIFFPGMIAFGVALIGLGRLFSKSEKEFITDFLISATQARISENAAEQGAAANP